MDCRKRVSELVAAGDIPSLQRYMDDLSLTQSLTPTLNKLSLSGQVREISCIQKHYLTISALKTVLHEAITGAGDVTLLLITSGADVNGSNEVSSKFFSLRSFLDCGFPDTARRASLVVGLHHRCREGCPRPTESRG